MIVKFMCEHRNSAWEDYGENVKVSVLCFVRAIHELLSTFTR